MKYICKFCKKEFLGRKRPDRIVKFCSQKCYGLSKKGKLSWNKDIPMKESTKEKLRLTNKGKHFSPRTEFKKGQKPWNFKGKYIIGDGYIHIYLPNHPRATKRGYILEHILIAEKYLKRHIDSKERIHHINGIRTDNDPKNLYVFQGVKEHLNFHRNPYPLKSNLT